MLAGQDRFGKPTADGFSKVERKTNKGIQMDRSYWKACKIP